MSKLAKKAKEQPKGNHGFKAVNKLLSSHVSEIGYYVRHLAVMPEAEHTIKDILAPEYWAHCTKTLQRHDKLHLTWADGTKYWELVVVDVGTASVKVVPLTPEPISLVSDGKELPEDDAEYKAMWGNPHSKWVVKRIKDNEIISKDHPNLESAQEWLTNYLKSM